MGLAACALLRIVESHAVQVSWSRERWTNPDGTDRNGPTSRGGLFQARPVLVEPLDQSRDQIVGASMRNILYYGRYIDHGIAFEDAQSVIIEIQ